MELNELKYKVDRIIINMKEYDKIMDYFKKKAGEAIEHKKRFFPLDSFYLDIECSKTFHYESYVQLVNYNPEEFHALLKEGDLFVKYDYDKQSWMHNFNSFVPGKTEKEMKDFATTIKDIIFLIMLYICEQSEKTLHVIKEKTPDYYMEIKDGSINNHRTYKDRECFLLNDVIKFVTEHPTKRSIQYLKDVWGVRGHIRHYQDGHEIFIKPYKKGRMRDTMEPESKTYLLKKETPDESE